jgi:hypothetical protein
MMNEAMRTVAPVTGDARFAVSVGDHDVGALRGDGRDPLSRAHPRNVRILQHSWQREGGQHGQIRKRLSFKPPASWASYEMLIHLCDGREVVACIRSQLELFFGRAGCSDSLLRLLGKARKDDAVLNAVGRDRGQIEQLTDEGRGVCEGHVVLLLASFNLEAKRTALDAFILMGLAEPSTSAEEANSSFEGEYSFQPNRSNALHYFFNSVSFTQSEKNTSIPR